MITIKTPFVLGNMVMGYGRTYGAVNSIAGEVTAEGVQRLRFSNVQGRSALDAADSYREFKNLTEADYKEFRIESPIKLGQTVIFYSPSYGKVGRLSQGEIDMVQFDKSMRHTLFWYRSGNNKVDRYNLYTDIEDFKRRTAPLKPLKEDERYVFTKYCIQQNRLEPVKIIEAGEVKSIVRVHGEDETIRNKYLYTDAEGFYKDMLEEINRKNIE